MGHFKDMSAPDSLQIKSNLFHGNLLPSSGQFVLQPSELVKKWILNIHFISAAHMRNRHIATKKGQLQ